MAYLGNTIVNGNLKVLNGLNANSITQNGTAVSLSNHTHNYAGSSSAGGAATSAAKLNTNAGSATQPVYFSNGVPVATTYALNATVPSGAKFTDTTYSAATTSAAGLMSAADKTKLDGIATGAQVNTVTGIKGNSESSYRTGNVNLTAANIGAAAASHGNHVPATQTANNAVFLRNDNTWQTVTPANIGAAASSHTHNYAGSSSAGGAATSLANFKVTTTANNAIDTPGSNAIAYASGLTKANWNYQQTDGGYYCQWYSASWFHEIFGDYRTGQISVRGNNNGTKTAWRRVLDESNYSSIITGYAAASHGNHVPTTQTANNAVFLRNDNTWQTVTPANIGAAASSHTHNYAGSSSAGGAATSATKLATARAIDGVNFDGSAAITHYGTCSTAAATAAKTVACTSYTLVTGSRIIVKFTVTNTAASPTLNVNSTGAKAIQYRGAAITAGYLAANRTYEFVYDGTNYQLIGDIDTNTKYTHPNTVTAGTAGTSSATSGSTIAIPYVTYNANGHITATGTHTHTVTGFATSNHEHTALTDSEITNAWNEFSTISLSNNTVTGDLHVNGDIYADHVYNAVYNDYAEFFPKGEDTEPGDVIVLDIDADHEQYIKSRAKNKIVVGVHTDEYAFLIGGNKVAEEENKKKFIPVSLAGRVKTKFIGPATKGAYVVASDLEGVARAYIKGEDDPENIFGILVEQDNEDQNIRKLKVKLK